MTLQKGTAASQALTVPWPGRIFFFSRWTSSHVALYVIRSRADFSKKGQDMHSHELHLTKRRLSSQPLIMQMLSTFVGLENPQFLLDVTSLASDSLRRGQKSEHGQMGLGVEAWPFKTLLFRPVQIPMQHTEFPQHTG